MDNPQVDLVDLNGDGLPDILQTGGPFHQAYINLGATNIGGAQSIRWAAPAEMASESGDAFNFSLTSDTTHLADMNGDGIADLVNKDGIGGSVFYFRNSAKAGWGERQNMELP